MAEKFYSALHWAKKAERFADRAEEAMAITNANVAEINNVVENAAEELSKNLNNPFSLLDYKWSEYEITNASWLLSNGQFNSGATYISVYNLLLEIYNGTTTKAGVSVKLSTEDYTDTDFVLNTTDTTFRLPVKVKLASGNAVVGNGMALGWTDGTNNGGASSSSNDSSVRVYKGSWGLSVGDRAGSGDLNHSKVTGITTDPTKSGIETSSSGLYLYFYVGETVQDANVIVASNALTDIANIGSRTHIVETYSNGASWYRVWSDGWCEQGGTSISKNITFLKAFTDTNYAFLVRFISSTSTSGTSYKSYFAEKSTTSVNVPYGVDTMDWFAYGYIR